MMVRIQKHERNFVILQKKPLELETLSWAAKGLWCYLLSKPDNWTIRISYLYNNYQGGRDFIRARIKELKEHGLCREVQGKENGKYSGLDYIIYEDQQPVEENPKSKKRVPQTDFQAPEIQAPENPPLIRTDLKQGMIEERKTLQAKEYEIKKEAASAASVDVSFSKPKKKKTKSDFSLEVQSLGDRMLEIILKHNPVYRAPSDMSKYFTSVENILEKDKQNPELLLKVFEYGVSDIEERGTFKGWQGVVVTNKKKGKVTNPIANFREHYSTIYSHSRSKIKRTFDPSSNHESAMESTEEMNKRAL